MAARVQIHWDRVHLWEQQSGRSLLDTLLLEEDGEEGDGGEEPAEEPAEELAEEPALASAEAPSWDGAQAGLARPSDTIEVLGIERLLGQVSHGKAALCCPVAVFDGCVQCPVPLMH